MSFSVTDRRRDTLNSFSQRYWQDVREGFELPVVSMLVSYKNAILHVAAGWDYMPGHHNPEFARAQGAKTIFLNTLFHQSFVDRVVTDWAGPLTFLIRRKISMKASIYADETISGHARVIRVWRGDAGDGRVDIGVVIRNSVADCCIADCTIRLPDRPPA